MVIIKKAVPGASETSLTRFAQRARRAAGLRGQVNVLLTSSRDIRTLNRRFRGKDKPTDVLSFPPADWLTGTIRRPGRSAGDKPLATSRFPQFSGDIVISTDIAARNARLYQHAPAQELKILILHGMLHLAGYDHESDRGRMARQEERLRRDLGLSDGLIRRSAGILPAGAAASNSRSRRVAHAPSRVRDAARSPSNAATTVGRQPSTVAPQRRQR